MCSLSYTLNRIQMRNDTDVREDLVSIGGALTGQMNSPNVCALLQLTSGLVGRKNRGRIFLPGILADEDVLTDGSIDPTARAAIQDNMDDLGAALAAVDVHPVILHSGVGTPTSVSGLTVASYTATQRRRLRR
jgi:hypothetical protein